jgi:hypothetical protein
MKALLLLAAALALSACSTPEICPRPLTHTAAKARQILQQTQQEHGSAALARVQDISVSYEGQWGSIGPRFQPILVDKNYRQTSEERLLLKPGIIAQKHRGPAGEKNVLRTRSHTAVSYNGSPTQNTEQQQAAALVANAYQLFLLGPHYFQRPGVKLDYEGTEQVLGSVKPGFGHTGEDRVLLFIDAKTHRLQRIRMTLNGLASTQGAEVDVTYADYQRRHGILWPTDFDERIRVPFDLHAHHWKMKGLDINRSLTLADISGKSWSQKAAKPATPLK